MNHIRHSALRENKSVNKRKITGQGMTEYIIIVALIALASIATVNLFGNAVQGAFGGMASVLGGGTSTAGTTAATTASTAIITEAGTVRDLGSYD